MNSFSEIRDSYIEKLSNKHLTLFCNLNCEKMLLGYEVFTWNENWGNVMFFKETVENGYRHLLSEFDKAFFEVVENELSVNFPDLDEFDSSSASYAFDTCCAFDEFIQFLKSGEKGLVSKNSQACINTVDMFIQEKENIGYVKDIEKLELLIANDQYMIREHDRQLNLLKKLDELPVIDGESLMVLREINASWGDIIDRNIIK